MKIFKGHIRGFNLGKRDWKYHLFVLALTLVYAFGIIFSEFYGMPFTGLRDFITLGLQWGVVVTATYGLMILLALNRYVFACLFTPLTLVCAVLAFFRYTANITLTPMLIDLCLVNDLQTGMTLVSVSLVLTIVFSLFVGVGFTVYRFKYVSTPSVIPNLLLGILLVLLFNGWIPRFERPVSERMPYSIYYNVRKYAEEKKQVSVERPDFEGNVSCGADSLTVVLVLGESLRADHLQINGYPRETTPRLSADSMVFALPRIFSPECFTHTSIPHILTRADSLNPQRAFSERSFISLFEKAGFRTVWLANQESVRNYVYFMNECDTLVYANMGKSVYVFDKWLDEDLLPFYRLEVSREEPKKLIILHTIGSHWWYESHYTDSFRKFEPVIGSRVVSACTHEELVNSYDNTIVYSDYFWSELIDSLRSKNAVLLYLSDHGESLGEDGYYLHGAVHPTLQYPAAFIWVSDRFAQEYPQKIRALEENADRYYWTDYLFHSILSAGDIGWSGKDSSLDVFDRF